MVRKTYTPGGNTTQTFVDLIDAGNAQAQLILKAIAQHADWNTGECWPTVRAISEIAKCSPKTVRRYLRKMKEDGLIEMEERWQDGEGESGRQTSNRIVLAGYAEWIEGNRSGAAVRKPLKVPHYKAPPGQDDHGTDEDAPLDSLGGASEYNSGPQGVVKESSGAGQSGPGPLDNKVSTQEPSSKPSSQQISPPPPRTRGARERVSDFDLIEELRREGKPAHILDHLIGPLSRAIIVQAKDHKDLFAEICALKELADLPNRALDELARQIKHDRTKLVVVKNVQDYLDKALRLVPRIKIFPDMTAQWTAWTLHYNAVNRSKYAEYCEKQGWFSELTEYPPGHWAFSRETPAFLVPKGEQAA